jgi:hypothetical protein
MGDQKKRKNNDWHDRNNKAEQSLKMTITFVVIYIAKIRKNKNSLKKQHLKKFLLNTTTSTPIW